MAHSPRSQDGSGSLWWAAGNPSVRGQKAGLLLLVFLPVTPLAGWSSRALTEQEVHGHALKTVVTEVRGRHCSAARGPERLGGFPVCPRQTQVLYSARGQEPLRLNLQLWRPTAPLQVGLPGFPLLFTLQHLQAVVLVKHPGFIAVSFGWGGATQ